MKEQQTWKRCYYSLFHEQNHQRVDLRQGCQGRRSQLRSCRKVLGGLFPEQISHADVYGMQNESPVHLVQTALRLGLGFRGRESAESCCEWGCVKAPKGVQVYPKASVGSTSENLLKCLWQGQQPGAGSGRMCSFQWLVPFLCAGWH